MTGNTPSLDRDKSKLRSSLIELREDFNHLRRSEPPIRCRLMHLATNAEAEGFNASYPHNDQCCTFGSAGNRIARVDEDENGQYRIAREAVPDVHGNPITNFAGEFLDVTMPAFRRVEISGSSTDAVGRLTGLAERAGRLTREMFAVDMPSFMLGWEFNQPTGRWWFHVFELAWSGRLPMVAAERQIWLQSEGATVFFPYDQTQITKFIESGLPQFSKLPAAWAKQLPDAYLSEIDDVASASKDVVDVLLKDLPIPQTVSNVSHPNGPEPPNQFWWEGKCCDIPPKPWRLLNALWKAEGKKIKVEDDRICEMWDSHQRKKGIENAINNIGTGLLNINPPFTVNQKQGWIILN